MKMPKLTNKRRYYLHRRLKLYPVRVLAAKRIIEVTPAGAERLKEAPKAIEYIDQLRGGGYSVQITIPL